MTDRNKTIETQAAIPQALLDRQEQAAPSTGRS